MNEPTAHYTVLARRFRPQAFDDVVGQEHVAQSLRNAIQQGRVAHAYLFTGARGVGKTSMARILAKALNCPNAVDAIPCNECEVCQGISTGGDVDVLEIDGASNRGIDDIRTLRSNVNVKSMRSKHKVYIIDEVHMLTKEAFNALLKTLEEPPPNVKFVFCTTEPNKLPDTILSRCQRFDFGTIATSSIGERLRQIAEAEEVNVHAEAIELVARRANGSMRDSQSLFDQLLAFGGEEITSDDVHRLFGTASDDRLLELMQSVVDSNRAEVMAIFNELLSQGVQLGELTDQLLNCLRDLMLAATGAKEASLLSVADSSRTQVKTIAQQWGLQTILAAMQILAETKSRMQRATHARVLVELALVRMTLLEQLDSIPEVIAALRGQSPSLPAAAATPRVQSSQKRAIAQIPPAGNATVGEPTQPRSEPETQKKTAVNPEITAETTVSEPVTPQATVVFDQENARAIWSQVLLNIDDMVKKYVQCVGNVAISGPNRLDLTFPRTYHWNKQYCERPEVLGHIEQVASKIAGQSVRISLVVVDDGTQEEAPSRPATTTRHQQLEDIEDEFVQHAGSIFEASLLRVEELSRPANTDE